MTRKNGKIDILLTLADYHENIRILEQQLKELLHRFVSGATTDIRETFEIFFRHNLIYHFRFEELIVFPAVLKWQGGKEHSRRLAEYLTVHQKILKEAEDIVAVFNAINDGILSHDEALRIGGLVARLGEATGAHAADENIHLVPLVRDTPIIRYLAGRNYITFRTLLRQLLAEVPRPAVAR